MTFFTTTLGGSSSENFDFLNFDLLNFDLLNFDLPLEFLNFDLLRISNFDLLRISNFDLLRISNRARRGAVLGDGLTDTWGHQLVVTPFVKVGSSSQATMLVSFKLVPLFPDLSSICVSWTWYSDQARDECFLFDSDEREPESCERWTDLIFVTDIAD